jgi:transposase
MKKFVRIKEINGKQYAYEITPYYDKKTKRIRQKSRYLGKYEDGEVKRVRLKLPRRVFDHGEFLPFDRILDELSVADILGSLLAEGKMNTLMVLVLNRVVHPVAVCNLKAWYEGTSLIKRYGNLPLSSQSLSEFLERIGESSLGMDFSERFIRSVGDGSPLLYDITSLSSASCLIDILEYGYNRDHLPLPQVNLSLVAHKTLGIPLFFDVYPGSVVDITTLKNTIQKLEGFGLKEPTLVLDRGFFSVPNLQELVEHGYDFILPASFASREVKSLVSRTRGEIENPKYLKVHEGKTVFVKEVSLDLGVEVAGFLFYDLKREQEEKSLFYQRLHTVKEKLRNRKLRPWEDPKQVFENICRDFSCYLRWKVKDDRFQVEVKNKSVAQRVNRMGIKVILSRGDHGWREVLSWTREKDIIEKMFMRIKNDLKGLPLRAHKTEVAMGLIFVTFLALILRSRLTSLLRETGLAKKYSVPSLLLELRKIKKVELTDGTLITTEITKKQREIIKTLKLSL